MKFSRVPVSRPYTSPCFLASANPSPPASTVSASPAWNRSVSSVAAGTPGPALSLRTSCSDAGGPRLPVAQEQASRGGYGPEFGSFDQGVDALEHFFVSFVYAGQPEYLVVEEVRPASRVRRYRPSDALDPASAARKPQQPEWSRKVTTVNRRGPHSDGLMVQLNRMTTVTSHDVDLSLARRSRCRRSVRYFSNRSSENSLGLPIWVQSQPCCSVAAGPRPWEWYTLSAGSRNIL